MTVSAQDMLIDSVLLTAHPDDEILWFSSVIEKVDKIILCFLKVPSQPDWTTGRAISVAEHPVGRPITYLEMDESEAFWGVDWHNPIITEYGLRITNPRYNDDKYISNFQLLLTHLREELKDCKNVITHNPWGEYGHLEHVQLYRAVKQLQEELGYDIWYSNYCSNRTAELMTNYISGFDCDYITLNTNKALGHKAMTLYQKNKCWTWYDDYTWFDQECFIKDQTMEATQARGKIFPINFIKVEPQPSTDKARKKPSFPRRFVRKLKSKSRRHKAKK